MFRNYPHRKNWKNTQHIYENHFSSSSHLNSNINFSDRTFFFFFYLSRRHDFSHQMKNKEMKTKVGKTI